MTMRLPQFLPSVGARADSSSAAGFGSEENGFGNGAVKGGAECKLSLCVCSAEDAFGFKLSEGGCFSSIMTELW